MDTGQVLFGVLIGGAIVTVVAMLARGVGVARRVWGPMAIVGFLMMAGGGILGQTYGLQCRVYVLTGKESATLHVAGAPDVLIGAFGDEHVEHRGFSFAGPTHVVVDVEGGRHITCDATKGTYVFVTSPDIEVTATAIKYGTGGGFDEGSWKVGADCKPVAADPNAPVLGILDQVPTSVTAKSSGVTAIKLTRKK